MYIDRTSWQDNFDSLWKKGCSSLYRNPKIYINDLYYCAGIYDYSFASINHSEININSIDLFPDYTVHSITKKICEIEISGDAIDDFFSPSTYFYYKKQHGTKNVGEVVYDDDIADTWKITVKDSIIKIVLKYGNILRRGIASDLKLHAKLIIKFEETDDYKFIYEIYLAVKIFFILFYIKRMWGIWYRTIWLKKWFNLICR